MNFRIRAKLWLISILVVWVGSAFLHFDGFYIGDWHTGNLYLGYVYLLATVFRFTKNKRLARWGEAWWLTTDQAVNVIHEGNPDVTVSSKVGNRAEMGSKTAAAMATIVDAIWWVATGQKNHCQVSIEHDEEHY